MKVTCSNCGISMTTDHYGAWDHTCPDGTTDADITQHVNNAAVTSAARNLIISFNDLTATANEAVVSLTAAWEHRWGPNR